MRQLSLIRDAKNESPSVAVDRPHSTLPTRRGERLRELWFPGGGIFYCCADGVCYVGVVRLCVTDWHDARGVD